MNFLAHIYLSGSDEQLMIGNFIADFVKGKKKDNYPDGIRHGIELHRFIDDFTDHHEIVLSSKSRIRSRYGKYSGVIIDLYYDHFLAANFSRYHELSLVEFSAHSFQVLKKNWSTLPGEVHYFLPFMIERNWLLSYSTVDGIGRALSGLSKRVSFENKMDESVNELRAYYTDFEQDFFEFFPLLTIAVKARLAEIKSEIPPVASAH